VIDTGETFAWGVWVSVSRDSFIHISERWHSEGREQDEPYYRVVSPANSATPRQPSSEANLRSQPVASTPVRTGPTDHPLAVRTTVTAFSRTRSAQIARTSSTPEALIQTGRKARKVEVAGDERGSDSERADHDCCGRRVGISSGEALSRVGAAGPSTPSTAMSWNPRLRILSAVRPRDGIWLQGSLTRGTPLFTDLPHCLSQSTESNGLHQAHYPSRGRTADRIRSRPGSTTSQYYGVEGRPPPPSTTPPRRDPTLLPAAVVMARLLESDPRIISASFHFLAFGRV